MVKHSGFSTEKLHVELCLNESFGKRNYTVVWTNYGLWMWKYQSFKFWLALITSDNIDGIMRSIVFRVGANAVSYVTIWLAFWRNYMFRDIHAVFSRPRILPLLLFGFSHNCFLSIMIWFRKRLLFCYNEVSLHTYTMITVTPLGWYGVYSQW